MRSVYVLVFFLGVTAIHGTQLQKVLILPIVNIEKDPNLSYLENSISSALLEKLREKLAFDELSEETWQRVAEQNYILRDELYTRSAAMNLGVLANQDIVIHGGFKAEYKKKALIRATAYVLDTKRKKSLSKIEMEFPVDSELFNAVNTIADRIEKEARKVIPSKEDASRIGLTSGAPFFSDWTLGLKAGAGFYADGYSKYFTARPPAITATLRTRLPKLHPRLTAGTGVTFMAHTLREGTDSPLQMLGVSATTLNFMLPVSFGYEFPLTKGTFLEPNVGGGYVFQSTSVTGNGVDTTLTNGFPFARLGFTWGYQAAAQLDILLSLDCIAYIERGVVTYLPMATGGVQYKI